MATRGEWGTRIGWAQLALALLAAVPPPRAIAQTCGNAAGGTLSGTRNTYYPGVGTAAAGATSIAVDTAAIQGASTTPDIAFGDTLLVIQMQDADIQTNNNNNYGGNNGTGAGSIALNSSGLYEYVAANGPVTAGAISITGAGAGGGLINTYRTAAFGAQGQRAFQVIRLPTYASATLSSGLTVYAWDGRVGGVLALDISGTLALGNATVSLDGMGFRGGGPRPLTGACCSNTDYRNLASNPAHGAKAEGIAGTPRFVSNGGVLLDTGVEGYPTGSQARGAPGNAGGGGTDGNPGGGNDENAGGGGGGNGGGGGIGGNTWNSNRATGGRGGAAFAALAGAGARMVLGGGGGAGSRNNAGPSGAGAGGGMVFIRAGNVTGTGTVSVNGVRPLSSANDGGGGGGAGGSVLIVVDPTGGLPATLTVNADGGGGGWANLPSPPAPDPPPGTSGTAHGPGGGGGGGIVFLSSAAPARTVAGAASGCTNGNPQAGSCLGAGTTQYGATAGANGSVSTTATLAGVPGVLPCIDATRATLRGLRVDPAGVVSFATGTQDGTLAFNAYATDDSTGRQRTLLTPEPIAAPLPDSVSPIAYRVDTRPISERFVLLEELTVGGRRRLLGPFSVGDPVLARGFEQIASRESAGLGHRAALRRARPGRAAQTRLAAEPGSVAALKAEVSAAGPVRLALPDLVGQGMPAGILAFPQGLRVTNLGRRVSASIERDAQGIAQALVFQAETLYADVARSNVYVIAWGGRPSRMTVPLTRSEKPPAPGFVRVKQHALYVPNAPRGSDPWFWDLLFGDGTSWPYGDPAWGGFDLPGLQPGGADVPVTIRLLGRTSHVHTVEARINGAFVGSATFTGAVPAILSGQAPAGSLTATGNQLSLTYTASGGSPGETGLVYLDHVDLAAPVDPPAAPVAMGRLVPFDPALPDFACADYLVLTHALFLAQANAIADLRRAEGRRAVVVDVERAYDAFSAGVVEPQAIRALVRRAARGGHLRDVLLVGDDTFDSHDYLGTGAETFIPSLLGWDDGFGRIPSENLYADVNGDAKPDVAIGRLPVATPEQAQVLLAKLTSQTRTVTAGGPGQSAGAAARSQLFAVDRPAGGRDASFRAAAEAVAGRYAGASAWADVSDGIDTARHALLDGLAAGPLVTHYFGHAGPETWSDEALLSVADVDGLAGSGRPTLLFTWACQAQWYQYLFGPSLGEALLLVPDGGALASFGPAGVTAPPLQRVLYDRLYEELFVAGRPLGEAIRRAKARAIAANPAARPVVEGFNLLGDPALRLRIGAGER